MINQPNNTSTTQNPVGRFMVAVGAVIEHRQTGKILIVQRSADQDWRGGEWEVGYGRIDQFEDPVSGLRREVGEEVGITDLEVGRVLSVWHIFRGSELVENELIGITYHCQTATDTVLLSNEHSEYRWVTPEEALDLITTEGIRRDVNLFIDLKNTTK